MMMRQKARRNSNGLSLSLTSDLNLEITVIGMDGRCIPAKKNRTFFDLDPAGVFSVNMTKIVVSQKILALLRFVCLKPSQI